MPSSERLARSEAREAQLELLERALAYVQKGDFGSAELYYRDALEHARSLLLFARCLGE